MTYQCIDGVKRQKTVLIYIERRGLGAETWNSLAIRGLEKSMKDTKKNRSVGENSMTFSERQNKKVFYRENGYQC